MSQTKRLRENHCNAASCNSQQRGTGRGCEGDAEMITLHAESDLEDEEKGLIAN